MSGAERIATAADTTPLQGDEGGSNVRLLQANERELLRLRLAERQRELEEKQQKLRLLQHEQSAGLAGFSTDSGSSTAAGGQLGADVGKNVAALMSEVMSKLKTDWKPAAAASLSETGEAIAPKADSAGALPTDTSIQQVSLGVSRSDSRRTGGGFSFKVQRVPSTEIVVKPKVVTCFDKSIQADLSSPVLSEGDEAVSSEEGEDLGKTATSSRQKKQRKKQKKKRGGEDAGGAKVLTKEELLEEGAKKNIITKSTETSASAENGEINQAKKDRLDAAPPVISEKERKKLMETPEFQQFFQHTTKVVERLLGQEKLVNAFADYSGGDSSAGTKEQEERLVRVGQYSSNLSGRAAVLDLKCSPFYPEVFLAAYGSKDSAAASVAAEGIVHFWSLAMTQRPEYSFTCQSQVCSAMFNRFQSSLIIGGTYAGNIVVWDTRAQTKPVQRSLLSARAHAHPVYSMEMVGTQHAHNLISVDTDGRLCVWALQMLGAPTETLDLKRGGKEICVECVVFQESEVNKLVIGAEDGGLLQANILGNKAGVFDSHEAHSGAVTSLHFHPPAEPGQHDYTELMLSTSVDWTVKLWSIKNTFAKPLQIFENYNAYVYDAAWHPTNPAIFAVVDGEGNLDLWNLASDWEAPVFRIGNNGESLHAVAKTKVAWSSDGRRLVCGGLRGPVEVWAVSNEYLQQRGDEAAKFERRVEEAFPETAASNVQLSRDSAAEFID